MIVVLKAPSLADRVAQRRRLAPATPTSAAGRSSALAHSSSSSARGCGVQGVAVQPEFSFTRVIIGFSAALDARAIALLERAAEVAGRLPGAGAYPASVSSDVLDERDSRRGAATASRSRCRASTAAASRSRCSTPASTARSRTSAAAFARGSTSSAADDRRARGGAARRARSSSSGTAPSWPGSSSAPAGPARSTGVAPGASVLPIRVAGWQRDGAGGWAVYARTDQLLAGLERAVDPNGDGDAHDAARDRARRRRRAVRRRSPTGRSRGRRGRAAARHARRRAGRERRPGASRAPRATAASPAPAAHRRR